MKSSGFSLTELIVVLALFSTGLAIAAPLAKGALAKTRVRSAAHEAAIAFARARQTAIRTCRETAVRVEQNSSGYRFAIYGDGNGDGVRNAEIDAGIDRPAGEMANWIRSDVAPGILQNIPVPDPSSPGHTLSRTQDPVRFNNSNLCSFSPLSDSTPGSLYLSDGKSEMAVVRVDGRHARVHLLFFSAGDSRWRQ